MVVNQELTFDLDSSTFINGVASQPVGYSHNLRIKFVKAGVQGYELQAGSTIELFYDQVFPVSLVSPVHKIESIGFVWNASLQVYETGFNATTRPLSIISLATFATRLSVVEGAVTTNFDFHTKFRNASLPPGVDPCDNFDEQVPAEVINYFRQNFRYGLLPDQPTLPAAGISKSPLVAAINTFTDLEKFQTFGFAVKEVDIPAGVFEVDVVPPTGIDPALVASFSVKRVSGNDEVEATGNFEVVSGNSRFYLSTSANTGTSHKLVITYGKR